MQTEPLLEVKFPLHMWLFACYLEQAAKSCAILTPCSFLTSWGGFFFFLLYVCIKMYLIMVEFTLIATNTYRARMTVVSQISFI